MTSRWVGRLTVVGSAVALALAPVLVTVKYMTGWAIIPGPFWVPSARAWLGAAFPAATPAELWMGFGTAWSVALLLMLGGFVALAPHVMALGLLPTTPSGALWLFSLMMGLCGCLLARGREGLLVAAPRG